MKQALTFPLKLVELQPLEGPLLSQRAVAHDHSEYRAQLFAAVATYADLKTT